MQRTAQIEALLEEEAATAPAGTSASQMAGTSASASASGGRAGLKRLTVLNDSLIEAPKRSRVDAAVAARQTRERKPPSFYAEQDLRRKMRTNPQ